MFNNKKRQGQKNSTPKAPQGTKVSEPFFVKSETTAVITIKELGAFKAPATKTTPTQYHNCVRRIKISNSALKEWINQNSIPPKMNSKWKSLTNRERFLYHAERVADFRPFTFELID